MVRAGLDIDYGARGSSLDDVTEQFESGLVATIQEHLKIYGTIENVLQVAPPTVWKNLLLQPSILARLTQLSFHEVPAVKQLLPGLHGIQYLQLATAA